MYGGLRREADRSNATLTPRISTDSHTSTYAGSAATEPKIKAVAVERYLEGKGDLVSRLIMGRVPLWVIGVINQLTKSP